MVYWKVLKYPSRNTEGGVLPSNKESIIRIQLIPNAFILRCQWHQISHLSEQGYNRNNQSPRIVQSQFFDNRNILLRESGVRSYYLIFHFEAVDNSLSVMPKRYLESGLIFFLRLFNSNRLSAFSNNAPKKALVRGGYFSA